MSAAHAEFVPTDYVPSGLGRIGQLVVMVSNGQLFKITKVMKVNYAVLDEDGREWKIRFRGVKAAPEGTVWGGPDRSELQAQALDAAAKVSIGDVVRVNSPKFPHKYLVVKQTSDARFKLQQIGGPQSLTAHASGMTVITR